ncbi:hypothetical protein [Streptomyces sp. CB01201]|uniref:hypothetical protein n=1 Tax=Streptomyces sp. CB01201 TaxID=2020324 RepID=UPI00131E5F2D|nr:hypothetical protein [Streptomyces sp. CB01201]
MPNPTVTVPTVPVPIVLPAHFPAAPVALLGAAVAPLPCVEPEHLLRSRPGRDGA